MSLDIFLEVVSLCKTSVTLFMASMIFSFDGLKQQKETKNIVRKEKIHQIRKERGPKRAMQKADEKKINRKYWRDRKCATVG